MAIFDKNFQKMNKLAFILLIISTIALQCGNPAPVNNGIVAPETTTPEPIDKSKTYTIEKTMPAQDTTPKEETSARVVQEKSAEVEGAFSYYADAALFKLCGSETKYPVEQNAAYLEMEKAYLRIEDRRIGEFIPMNVEGEFKMTRGMEGGEEKTFVPTKLKGVFAG